MKEDSFPHPGNPLHQWGRELGQKRSCRGFKESTAVSLQQTKQRHAQRICTTSLQSSAQACWYVWVLGAETWDSEDRPGDWTGFGCTQTARRGWSVVSAQPGVYAEEDQVGHRSKTSLLRGS